MTTGKWEPSWQSALDWMGWRTAFSNVCCVWQHSGLSTPSWWLLYLLEIFQWVHHSSTFPTLLGRSMYRVHPWHDFTCCEFLVYLYFCLEALVMFFILLLLLFCFCSARIAHAGLYMSMHSACTYVLSSTGGDPGPGWDIRVFCIWWSSPEHVWWKVSLVQLVLPQIVISPLVLVLFSSFYSRYTDLQLESTA